MRKLVPIILGLFGVLAFSAPAYATGGGSDNDCSLYYYTGTKISLCDRFHGHEGKLDCKDIKFQVQLDNKTNDPWGLDEHGVGNGLGCESYPPHPKPSSSPSHTVKPSHSPSPSASHSHSTPPSPSKSHTPRGTATRTHSSPVTGPVLPLTGPGVGSLVALGGVVVLGGAAIIWAVRRRKTTFQS